MTLYINRTMYYDLIPVVMFLKTVFIFYLFIGLSYGGDIYDSFSGLLATEEQLAEYTALGVLDTCTIEIQPCNATERRRVDGSCNNLKQPARGTRTVPQPRLLPPHYFNVSDSRKAASGKDLTLERVVRLYMLKSGKSSHSEFNQNVPGWGIFMFTDIGRPHDTENMFTRHSQCCEKEHMNDYACTPTIIPENDPVHSMTGVRCMNSTRPLTFQDYSCTKEAVPSLISYGTPSMDLSNIYNALNTGENAVRAFSGGKLATEEENGISWPPSGSPTPCLKNSLNETRCFKNYLNAIASVTMFTVWLVNNHNYIAEILAEVNPCWDDDFLFYTAKDINIAFSQEIYLRDWMVALQGYDNLVTAGVIAKKYGFRDMYDENTPPEVTVEFSFALRWFHVLQESSFRMYDTNGTYLKEYSVMDMTFRTGFFANDKNMEHATQGSFRYPCSAPYSIDANVCEHGFPGIQKALDITSGDVNKCRHSGLAPYIDYLQLFTGHNITCFEDLAQHMSKDQITQLKKVYDHVSDIDMIAGMWAEDLMEGGHIPYTLACIINDSILRSIKGDRHYYERPNRPYAFTDAQLAEIRKGSLALLLCNVGPGVTEVPRKAFYNIGPKNPLVPCSAIPKMDFTAWAACGRKQS